MEQHHPEWQIILDQREEIRQLKRNRFTSQIKVILISVAFGWLGMPFVFNIFLNSFLPQPIKETVTVINAWYSDTTLGLRCVARNQRQ